MSVDIHTLKKRVLAARASVKAKLKQLKQQQHNIKFAYKPLATVLANTLSKHTIIPNVVEIKKENPKLNLPYADETERSFRKEFYKQQRKKFARVNRPSFSTPEPNKFQDIEEEVFETSSNIEDVFPTEPDKQAELDISMFPESSIIDYLSQIHPLPREYIEGRMRNTEKGIFDDNYVHHDIQSDKIMFGNSELNFFSQNSPDFKIGEHQIPGTRGLFELIFMYQPNEQVITENDKLYYGLLIRATNANKINFEENGKQIGNKSRKYTQLVKPSLTTFDTHMEHKGEGMQQYNQKPVEYIYWDDPNELVERLRLLIASRSSGNNAHVNEINSIVEELRERKIIY